MAAVVYLLCALTSLACAALLWRGWRRTRVRLLLWTCACFLGLAANNALLFVDVQLVPERDLATIRQIPALLGVGLLLYGMVWERR
jgi:hypothetical protein